MDLLIGVDVPEAFIDVEIKHGNEGEPIAKQNVLVGVSLDSLLKSQSTVLTRLMSDTWILLLKI